MHHTIASDKANVNNALRIKCEMPDEMVTTESSPFIHLLANALYSFLF